VNFQLTKGRVETRESVPQLPIEADSGLALRWFYTDFRRYRLESGSEVFLKSSGDRLKSAQLLGHGFAQGHKLVGP